MFDIIFSVYHIWLKKANGYSENMFYFHVDKH